MGADPEKAVGKWAIIVFENNRHGLMGEICTDFGERAIFDSKEEAEKNLYKWGAEALYMVIPWSEE